MNEYTLSGPTLLPDNQIVPSTVVVRGGVISEVQPGLSMLADITTDGYIAPGFIDLQLNGAYGADFTTDPAAVAAVAARLPETGVTAFLPTLITSPFASYASRLHQLALAAPGAPGAQILGVHLEGPYLSPARHGAHDPALLRPIDIDEMMAWAADPLVRIVTLAPELPGALDAIRRLRALGKIVSAGHSNATFVQAMAALDAGIGGGTHLFNAMPELHQREPGLAGALLATAVPVGLIADGVHVHPEMLEMAVRLKGADGIALVTDAMAAMGMPTGMYQLAGRAVHVDAQAARLANGTLAGSILTMDAAVRSIIGLTHCSHVAALTMASRTPARLTGLASKGHVAVGYDADVVVLDPALHVTHTMIRGAVAYAAHSAGPIHAPSGAGRETP